MKVFSYIAPLVANGTIMWGKYDPAAPFYGWDFFTFILTTIAFASIVWFILETLNNPPIKLLNKKILLGIICIWAGNIWGYAASGYYLDITQLRHASAPVFGIWFTFQIVPIFLLNSILKHRKGDQSAAVS